MVSDDSSGSSEGHGSHGALIIGIIMELLEILQNIWFLLIGILFVGYSILDGFDLGLGSLFPFLAKSEEDQRSLLNIIWPFWDGNEVWLLTAGGALFAAFPHAYATVFSGFYLALMLVLLALILRAVSLEFWFYDEKRRGLWEKTFIIGSFLPSLLFGVALGNVIIGIPLNESMDFTGNFFRCCVHIRWLWDSWVWPRFSSREERIRP
jgi:cytochrome d ubiquinol oxidase subunit II